MEQRSPEWYAAKLGKVGASRIADIMAKTKTGYSTSRQNYMAELVCERLTGSPADNYVNSAMQWGIDNEAAAKAAYCFMTDATIDEVGFVEHPSLGMAGASPDGLVGADGLIETKCPLTATHIDFLLQNAVDRKYLLQVQFQMAVTCRAWCDFVSFDPRMPAEMQLWIKRIPRDDGLIKEIEGEVMAFLVELNDKVKALQSRYVMKDAA